MLKWENHDLSAASWFSLTCRPQFAPRLDLRVCEREGTQRLTGTFGSFTLEEQSEAVLCLHFSDCLLYKKDLTADLKFNTDCH